MRAFAGFDAIRKSLAGFRFYLPGICDGSRPGMRLVVGGLQAFDGHMGVDLRGR